MIFELIEPLCLRLRQAGIHVTIETAGTVFRDVQADLMSISPKLANSTPPPSADGQGSGGGWPARHEARRINLKSLQQLIDSFSDHQLKFVVSTENDLIEIESILAKLTGWRPSDVLLMPEGTRLPSREESDVVVKACLERGWRYCHRLHIELFGNTKGT
jgi:7-carboxy-7-deazaguanine synthase